MAAQGSYVPSHPGLFVAEFLPGNFASRLVSLKVGFFGAITPFLRGALLCPTSQLFNAGETITGVPNYTRVRHMAYNTIQCGSGPEDNLVLNSDLHYGEIGLASTYNGLEGGADPLIQ